MESLFLLALTLVLAAAGAGAAPVYPGDDWERRSPEQVGMKSGPLDRMAEMLGGRGCVVRQGYLVYSWGDVSRSADVASAMKPLLSTLLLLAVKEGKLKSVDARLSEVDPRLRDLNQGKDAGITWRHLASQTSGYGLEERPGEAWSYNDYALALYYDTLMDRVFRQPGTEVLRTRLAEPLGFQDAFTFEAFGPKDRPGRLAASVRDMARFGLLWLRGGRWRGKQILPTRLVRLALESVVPADLPQTSGREATMLPGQRTLGGTRSITPAGPGLYTFNWWVNRRDARGNRLAPDAPPDSFMASGHGGKRVVWIFPSLDLVVSWNDARVEDHDTAAGNPNSSYNRVARLLLEALGRREGPGGA